MITMKKLDLFWRHNSLAIKIYTAEAVFRSKLLYELGLESAQVIHSVSKSLETFQLKVSRQLLKMDTVYGNRANTNNVVFQLPSQHMEEGGKTTKVVSFEEVYRKLKIKAA